MKTKKKSPAVVRTTEEFASQTTVHGISYIFDRSLPMVDRLLWLVVVVSFLGLASYLTYNSYTEWRGEQVITTLKDTVMPVTEVAFPAITICGGGNHMDNVERAVLDDFTKWRQDNERKGIDNIGKDMANYMVQIYQITDKDTNIMDILDMMIASNVEKSVAANAVRKNVLSCTKTPTEPTIETAKLELKGPAMFISIDDKFQLVTPNMSVLLPFSVPDSRKHHVAEFLQDKVILCGGSSDGSLSLNLDTCYQLSPSCSGRIESLTQARQRAASASVGDSMLVLAGVELDGVIDTIEKYDLNSETWTKTSWKTPTAEGSSCAVSIHSTKVMFLGGSTGGMGRRKAHILDVTDGSWTSLPDAPSDMKNSGCSTGSYQGNKGVFVSV